MRCSLSIIVLSLLLASSTALAAPDIDRLERELSDYEWMPNRAALDRHGPEVAAMLHHIVRQSPRAIARTRALAALRFYPSAKTRQLLLQQIQINQTAKRGAALLDLRQALTAYAAVAGTKALALVTRFLSHANLDVRCAAAAAIRLTGSSKATALLSAQLGREKSSTVRAELKRQIRSLEKKKRR